MPGETCSGLLRKAIISQGEVEGITSSVIRKVLVLLKGPCFTLITGSAQVKNHHHDGVLIGRC